jgi:hypothetical protein
MDLDPKKAEEYRKEVEATAKSTEDIKNDLRDILFATRDYAQESREAAKAVFESSIQAGSTSKAFRELTQTTRDIRREFEDIVGGTKTMSDISKDLQKLETRRKNLLVEQEQAVSAIFTEYQFGAEAQDAINKAMGSTVGLQDVLFAYGKDLTKEQQNLLNLYIEQGIALQDQDSDLEEVAKRAKAIDSAMRPLGDKAIGLQDAAEGLSKGLSKAGLGDLGSKLGIDDALKGTREMASSLTKGGTEALTTSDKMKLAGNFAKTLGSNLTKALGPAALIAMAIEQVVKAFQLIDGSSGKVAKNMGISAESGRQLVSASADAAAMSGDLLVSTKDVVAAQMALNAQFGTSVEFAGKFAAEFASIQERTGLSSEVMGKFAEQALITGTNIKDQVSSVSAVTTEMSAQSGIMLNQKDIQEGLKDISDSQRLINKFNTKELAEQVFQTKLLGVSQAQLEKMGSSLLDFESSIAAEMEAELLTGKQLNLEGARQAALMGDQAALAAELRKEVGTAAEFGEMNVIQQEALAKAMGMGREEMASMLVEQEKLEAVKRAGFKTTSAAQEAFNKLVEDGMTAEQAAAEMKKKGIDDAFAEQMKSTTQQEKLNAAMEKLTDLFVQIVDPLMPLVDALMGILQPIMSILSPIAKLIGDIVGLIMTYLNPLLKSLSTYFEGFNDVITGIFNLDFDMMIEGFKKIGRAIISFVVYPIDGAIELANLIPGVDIPLASTKLTGMVGLAEGGVVTKPTTALIGEGGEPEAVVPLSKAQSMGFGGSDEIKQTNALLKELIVAVKQGGDVYIDGAKAGKSLTLATSRMG